MLGYLALLTAFSALACARDVIVNLGYAQYRGQELSNGVAQWLGIRYAAPPVGPLRFSAPQDPEDETEIQNATQHGSMCIRTSRYPAPEGSAEDCLFLDVYAPAGATGASPRLLPVYVFIQGGGFSSNGNPYNNGTGLVQASDMNIVVVNFNYRVGPYGFLAGSEIVQGGSVNNGLKDQIKVLEWVQSHIKEFGGDPDHVVLGGDSAGGASVTLLLSAYGGRDDGLFHAAAAESQSFANMLTVDEAQYAYDNLVNRTGCTGAGDTLGCLRDVDIDTLQRENIVTPFPGTQRRPLYMYGPVIDDNLVPDYTYRMFQQGRFIKVPVIFGDVTNEGTKFVPENLSSLSAVQVWLQAQWPALTSEHFSRINEYYLQVVNSTQPYPNSTRYWRPVSDAYGEIRYVCPGIALSGAYADANVSNWNYRYAVQDPDDEASGLGVYHVVELNAIWGPENVYWTDTVGTEPPASYYTSNADIIPIMQGYWTSFIRSYDPNTYRYQGSPRWEEWSEDERIFIRTGETRMESVPGNQKERCEYLTSIGVELRQ
ncbi:putative triacylglycerol lipase [Aspergillus mulundensis]|uniref:Carboxylic ester hydrolase n=1 Tax=Aspergillus mulundensis TaxID=1810919 RepID=A0A3D8S6T6_9EURO|nr:Carboxylic ester hydrolase [Aspergillus mulundensis]RDW81781.1 Carboxylic ester hydrolase [Aspergillus mulundensis]